MYRSLAMTLLLLMVTGCATMDMRRSNLEKICDFTEIKLPEDPNHCAQAATEKDGDRFKIAYVEFTDQGWLYDRRQLEQALTLLKEEPGRDLQVVLFVHGWKHSAKIDDRDVQYFRVRIMPNFARRDPQARTVGIYVSWRGAALEVPDWIQNITFYDRKSTAELVARGSVRELLSHVRAIKQRSAGAKREVNVTAIGHSFGGLILFNSLAASLLDAVVEANSGDTDKPRRVVPIFDRVVLLNPAFEASRFEPLFQAAKDKLSENGAGWRYDEKQLPIFISITSEADKATRLAFPLGRAVTSLFQHEGLTDQDDPKADYADRLEKRANTHTLGHMSRYQTHFLTLKPGADPTSGVEPIVCSVVRNPLVGEDMRFPLWSMYTSEQVITGHSDIFQQNLWQFIADISGRKSRARELCG